MKNWIALGAVVAATLACGGERPNVSLKPGDVAPAWTLPGSDGKTYSLSDYRGERPVVIAWFGKAFTGG